MSLVASTSASTLINAEGVFARDLVFLYTLTTRTIRCLQSNSAEDSSVCSMRIVVYEILATVTLLNAHTAKYGTKCEILS